MNTNIKNWVIVMFENRSFDSLLGYLPHIAPEDGIRDRDIELPYPGGTVRVHPSTNFTDPIPDPGEEYPAINAQIYGRFRPAENAGLSPYAIFPDHQVAPFNEPEPGQLPTMDGFALDFFHNSRWQTGRDLTDNEMQSIGGVFTPESAPVINGLAREYAVFTHWHCDVPTCTFPNRSFFHAGSSDGRLGNDIIWDYAWDNDLPNLFTRATDRGVTWTCYFDKDQKIPYTAVNQAGGKHLPLWRDHSEHHEQFFADCAAGSLPQYSWIEPCLVSGNLNDYHPPTDIRAGEAFLASIYEAVRSSPQWEQTALVVMFDEHGGCYDHVPPPATVSPDDRVSSEGFAFDRLGVRVPTIVISAYTERETVITDLHSNTSMTRTLREALDLGPALTKRDAWAEPAFAAFNRDTPRTDRPVITALPYSPGGANPDAQEPVAGDLPDTKLFWQHKHAHDKEYVSQIGQVTVRNAARLLGLDPDEAPSTSASGVREWLEHHFVVEGRPQFEPGPSR